MSTSPQAGTFLAHWVDACNQRHDVLFRDWPRSSFFTAHVFTAPNCIVEDIASRLQLRSYCCYYCIDAIFFGDEDFVPERPVGTTWVRRIKIAFEHENDFYSGLFQEVSHLLITDCDLRVLVSYPNNPEDLDRELEYLHGIIKGSDRSAQLAQTGGFLFIVGWRHVERGIIEWLGYIYEHAAWRKL